MTGLLIQNTLLKQAEDRVEKTVPPAQRDNYLKIVVAGMKYAMDKGPEGLLASLKDSKDPLADSVKGAIAIVGVLRGNAKGTMPLEAMIPATMSLMFQALDFAEKMNLLTVTETELDKAAHMFMDTILPLLNVPKAKLDESMDQVHGIMRDPDKMAQYKGQQNGAAKLG